MPGLRIDTLNLPRRRSRFDSRLWREWCFWRVVLRRIVPRAAVILAVLLAGGAAFYFIEGRAQHSFVESVWYAWSLIFAQPPEAFPRHSVILQVMYFLFPVLGLVLIIEGIVDIALVVRERGRSERKWCLAMAGSLSDHIVLVGLGRLGYRTYRLLRRLGEAVVVIERQEQGEFIDVVRRDGCPLFVADARHEAVLVDANIGAARSIVVATNDDLANLEIALDARRLNPNIAVILRMFDQNMADKVRQGFNIRIAMSQSAISAPAFAMAAIDRTYVSTYAVDDELITMQQWQVREGGVLAGKTVGDVAREMELGVVRHKSGDNSRLFPPPEQRLRPGDELLIQAPFRALIELQKRGVQIG